LLVPFIVIAVKRGYTGTHPVVLADRGQKDIHLGAAIGRVAEY
jgi:hypothetical protein